MFGLSLLLCLCPCRTAFPLHEATAFTVNHYHSIATRTTAPARRSDRTTGSGLLLQLSAVAGDSDAALEKTWRYVKKPLISIGSKGAALSHGNSLRELLDAHQAVKVKINNLGAFDGSLEQAFDAIKRLAEQSGAPVGIELLQSRESDRVIMFGAAGTRSRILAGSFPPTPPPPPSDEDSDSS